MDAANEITRLVADPSGQLQTQVPYEAIMLGYYGRQPSSASPPPDHQR
jgi:hypothetical protein